MPEGQKSRFFRSSERFYDFWAQVFSVSSLGFHETTHTHTNRYKIPSIERGQGALRAIRHDVLNYIPKFRRAKSHDFSEALKLWYIITVCLFFLFCTKTFKIAKSISKFVKTLSMWKLWTFRFTWATNASPDFGLPGVSRWLSFFEFRSRGETLF